MGEPLVAHAMRRSAAPGRIPVGLAVALLLMAGTAEAGDPAESPAPGEQAESAPSDGSTDPEAETPEEEAKRIAAEELMRAKKRSQQADPSNVETPIFPEVRYRDAVRLRVTTRFLPGANFETYRASLYQPTLRARITIPLSERSVLQLTPRASFGQYSFSGAADPLGLGRGLDDLNSASLVLQAAHQLNAGWWLLTEGETWSLLANAFARSRWESGAFADALTYGGALALGYQNDNWRVALGLSLASPLTGGGVDVGFVGSLRWDPTKRLTLRNRGRGLQIEYELGRALELFVAGYLDSQTYLLDTAGDVTLRDRQILAGAGFEWKISKKLRLNLEAGVVASRDMRVKADNGPTLSSQDADAGGYADIRIEIRP